MAMLRCVGLFILVYIYFHIFKNSASLIFWFAAFCLHGHTLRVFHLCFVPVLFSFVSFGQTHKQENTKKHEGKQHRNKTQMRNMQNATT
jgi:hypothetical protein